MVTHNETSTGVTNDLESIAKVVKGAGKLLLVDAISSLSSVDLQTDKWGCDVVISGSQKGWMVPPGMALVASAGMPGRRGRRPRCALSTGTIGKCRSYLEKVRILDAAVSIVFAFSVALDMMLKEGLPAIFARHKKVAAMTREGVKAMGMKLFAADEKYASNTRYFGTVPGRPRWQEIPAGTEGRIRRGYIGGQQKLTGRYSVSGTSALSVNRISRKSLQR
jgi:aspartate aminotransferase-like enzyme